MNIPNQKKGNLWIGASLYYYSRAMFYLSVAGFFMTMGTFWHTTFSESYNIPLPIFLLAFVALGVGVILIDHIWLTPSLTAYSNKLGKEQNPILEQIIELRCENKELKEVVERISISKK